MAVLGLILIVFTGVLTAAVFLGNTDTTSAQALGQTLSGISLGGLFLAGAVTGLLFAFGLYLLLQGARRSRRRKLAHRQVVQETRQEQASLAAEKERLERELEQERQGRASSRSGTEPTSIDSPEASNGGSEPVSDKPRLFRR